MLTAFQEISCFKSLRMNGKTRSTKLAPQVPAMEVADAIANYRLVRCTWNFAFLEIVLLQPGNLHERAKQSLFQRLISVDGDDDPFTSARHRKNVMATVNPSQYPTAPLDNLGKLATGNLLHTVTSSTRSAVPAWAAPSSASSQPWIASRTFVRRSSIVSPCETHPGNAGTSAQ